MTHDRSPQDNTILQDSAVRHAAVGAGSSDQLAKQFAEAFDEYDECARRLATVTNAAQAAAILDADLPALLQSLEADCRGASLDSWGESTSIDSLVGPQIPVGLIDLFAEMTGQSAVPERLHAGLSHTYGLLLSAATSEHGHKRHRWSSGLIAFPLGRSPLWPLDAATPLLHAVTTELTRAVDSDETAFVEPRDDTDIDGRWIARTIVRTRPDRPAEPDSPELLLIHLTGPERALKLNTAFCITASRAHMIHDEGDQHVLRFNAAPPHVG